MSGFGLHHCDEYLVAQGRICDKPATNLTGLSYRCDEHHPYLFIRDGLIVSFDPLTAPQTEEKKA